MSTITQTNVLKLDSKEGQSSKNTSLKKLKINYSRDNNLTEFGKSTLIDRYLLPGEKFQDMFMRVARNFSDDDDHAQRIYDYISKLWFMPATPVLSNGGACVTISEVEISVSKSVLRIFSRCAVAASKVTCGSQYKPVVPKGRRRSATWYPMRPIPIIPTVRPITSRERVRKAFTSHLPFRSSASA